MVLDYLRLPNLEIMAEIGRGAASVVYQARRDDRLYAVKVATPADSEANSRARVQLRREAALLGSLRHAGLPAVVEVGDIDGRPYLVMDFVPGRTLEQLLAEGPMPVEKVAHLGATLAGALALLHQDGFVHRDVKPQNIVVDTSGRATLIDFGFAVRAGPVSKMGGVAGTFKYCAPEQAGLLRRPVDGRSDLYALGVVLYECASGVPPFRSSDVAELTRQHAFVAAPLLSSSAPATSPALEQIVARLLAKDPDDRYQSGAGLRNDLLRLHSLDASLAAGEAIALDTGVPPSSPDTTTLVGRDTVLTALVERWAEARDGQVGAVLLAGEVGMGKSRLLGALAARAEAEGALVMSARCQQEHPPPLGGIHEAVQQWMRKQRSLGARVWDETVTTVRAVVQDSDVLLSLFSLRDSAPLASLPDLAHGAPNAEQIYSAVAASLAQLAHVRGGLLLVLDDAQWLDDASRRVLTRLLTSPAPPPLLIVCGLRTDAERDHGLESLACALGDDVASPLTLAPLGAADISRIGSALLGGALSSGLEKTLEACSHGNPYTLLEYVRALREEGMLRPCWGRWELHTDALERLQLPTDVLLLLGRRVASLEPQTREILRLAALLDLRISTRLLSLCWVDLPEGAKGDTSQEVHDALAEGLACNLLTRIDARSYAFVHGRAREAMLAGVSPDELAQLHQRIAEALDHPGADLANLARHYARGVTSRRPQRVYQTNLLAGVRALANLAYEEAYRFLQMAHAFATSAGLPLVPEHEEALGEACARTRRAAEAKVHFLAAMRRASDPLLRGRLSCRLSNVHMDSLQFRAMADTIKRSLAELGAPTIPVGWMTVPRLLVQTVRATFSMSTGIGYGSARGAQRERALVLSDLYHMLAAAEYFTMRPLPMVEAALRAVHAGHRAGPSQETALAYAHIGVLQTILKRPASARRVARRARSIAEEVGDPTYIAHCSVFEGLVVHLAGEPLEAQQITTRVLEDGSRWLALARYVLGATDLAWNLQMRGYFKEASKWIELAFREGRLAAASGEASQPVLMLQSYRVSLLGCMGRLGDALAALPDVRAQISGSEAGRWFTANLLGHLLLFYWEQGELGPPLEEVIREYTALGLHPRSVTLHNSHYYVFQAYARVAQLVAANAADRPLRRRQAHQALRALRQVFSHPTLQAHTEVITAQLLHAERKPRAARARLQAAETLARMHDNPWVSYECARLHAAILNQQGNRGAAQREAWIALGIAQQHGWSHRVRHIRETYRVAEAHRESDSYGRVPLRGGSSSAEQIKLERQLEALLQLGLASVNAVAPRQQAIVALDEMARLLGAERAFLFTLEGDPPTLRQMAARDASRQDLTGLSTYSSRVVNEVWSTGQAVVVSGSEEAELLGSVSAVVHDLRSILAAPLMVRDDMVGVVYLDTRVARGVFTRQDVEILTAVANHIAIAMETSRAVHLEAAVASEEEQRRTAERLRAATAAMTSTLHLPDVLDALLDGARDLVTFDHAVAALWEEDAFVVMRARGFTADSDLTGRRIVPAEEDAVALLVRDRRPSLWTGAQVKDWLSSAGDPPLSGSWMGVPVLARDEVIGMLALSAQAPRTFDEGRTEVVFALASQAGVAIEHARLFSQVQRLASTDELTRLNNRRAFLAQSERELERAVRLGRPLSAVMLDVDHFKHVNDTHGHAVGDDVLKAVASCLRGSVRAIDVVGRYGGEEFAIVLPEQDLRTAVQMSAERVRQRVEETPLTTEAGLLRVTVSVGVASLRADDATLESLLRRADAALYAAKAAGRNRVVADDERQETRS